MLQLEAEERIGALTRLVAEMARAREDAAFAALKVAHGGPDGAG